MDDTVTQDMPPWEGDEQKIASGPAEQKFFDVGDAMDGKGGKAERVPKLSKAEGDEVEMWFDELKHGNLQKEWMEKGDKMSRALEARAEAYQGHLQTQAERFSAEATRVASEAWRKSPEAKQRAEQLQKEEKALNDALTESRTTLQRAVLAFRKVGETTRGFLETRRAKREEWQQELERVEPDDEAHIKTMEETLRKAPDMRRLERATPIEKKEPRPTGLIATLEQRLKELEAKAESAPQFSDERNDFLVEAKHIRLELATIARENASKATDIEMVRGVGQRERARQRDEDAIEDAPKMAKQLSDETLRRQVEVFKAESNAKPENVVLKSMALAMQREVERRGLVPVERDEVKPVVKIEQPRDVRDVARGVAAETRELNTLKMDYAFHLGQLEAAEKMTTSDDPMEAMIGQKALEDLRKKTVDFTEHLMKLGVDDPVRAAIQARPLSNAERKRWQEQYGPKEMEVARKAEQGQYLVELKRVSTLELEQQLETLRQKMKEADVPKDEDIELFDATEKVLLARADKAPEVPEEEPKALEQELSMTEAERQARAAAGAEKAAEEARVREEAARKEKEEAEARAKALEQKLAAEAEAIAKKNREAEAAQPDDKAKAEALFGRLGKEADAPAPSREEALNAAEALFSKSRSPEVISPTKTPLWQELDTPEKAREAYVGDVYRAIAELDQLKDEEKPRGREDLLSDELKVKLGTIPHIEASLAIARLLKDQKMIDVLQEYLEERRGGSLEQGRFEALRDELTDLSSQTLHELQNDSSLDTARQALSSLQEIVPSQAQRRKEQIDSLLNSTTQLLQDVQEAQSEMQKFGDAVHNLDETQMAVRVEQVREYLSELGHQSDELKGAINRELGNLIHWSDDAVTNGFLPFSAANEMYDYGLRASYAVQTLQETITRLQHQWKDRGNDLDGYLKVAARAEEAGETESVVESAEEEPEPFKAMTVKEAKDAYIGDLYREISRLEKETGAEAKTRTQELLPVLRERIRETSALEGELATARAFSDSEMVQLMEEFLERRQVKESGSVQEEAVEPAQEPASESETEVA